MSKEYSALINDQTWTFLPLAQGMKVAQCR